MTKTVRPPLIVVALLLLVGHVSAKNKYAGFAEGGASVVTSGISSTNKARVVCPNALVTVLAPGTASPPIAIYSDDAGTPKGNGFNSSSDGSYQFYADVGTVDIRFSGTCTGVALPFTLSSVLPVGVTSPLPVSQGARGDRRSP